MKKHEKKKEEFWESKESKFIQNAFLLMFKCNATIQLFLFNVPVFNLEN